MPLDRRGVAATWRRDDAASVDEVRPRMPEQTIFASLAAGRRNWAVASVHGEAERLTQLHVRLAERIAPSDNLVYLGNFLGRGDDVADTVDELLVFRRALMAEQISGDAGDIVYLRGSQEEMWHKLLQVQFAPNPRQVLEWMLTQGVAPTLEAYGGLVADGRKAAALGAVALSQWTNRLRARVRATDGHDRLISVLRRAAYTEDGTLLFVNAGIDPNRPLSEQTDSFWWGGGKFESIEASYGGFNCVVRGFDHHHRGVIVKDHIASIDGGCGFGGPLVAACFDAAGRLIETIEA